MNEIAYIWGGRRATVFPRVVESSVAIFDDEDDARQATTFRAELIRFMVGTSSPRGFEPLPGFGHDAVRFRSSGDNDVPAEAGVIWRNGNLLAIVLAGGEGMTRSYADDKAVELAVRQQKRIESPRAQEPPEKRDVELPLDDPTLDVPVYWLGRTFEPGGGLPALELGSAWAGSAPPELGWTAEMDYGARKPLSVVKISVFSPAAFETFERGVLGRQVIGARCAESTEQKVPGGHAVIWRGFAKPVDGACPNRPYDRYVAYVYLEDAVVSINQPWCIYPCASPLAGNPYNTERGVAVIAKSLRVREPRADAAGD